MKRKIYWLILPSLCLILFPLSFAQDNEPSIKINKIFAEIAKLHTNIIIESDGKLPITRSYYAQKFPLTLVIELGKAQFIGNPQIEVKETTLVKRARFEKNGSEEGRLLVELAECVPYRIISKPYQTILELAEIQRNQKKYILDSEIQKKLEASGKREIFLNKLDISDRNNQIKIKAMLTEETIYNTFALDNPLRLVVDLFNTYCTNRISSLPVKKAGVERVRIAQFQTSDPYAITRMVFDLNKGTLYSLSSEKDGIAISFFEESDLPQTNTNAALTPLENQKKPKSQEAPAIPRTNDRPQVTIKETSSVSANASAIKTDPKKETQQETKKAESQTQEEKFKPKSIVEPEEKYTGEILSLKFKDADLRDVILFLGEFAHLNVVFDPEVRGLVTCNLEDVPWDQALDIILRNNKMGKTIEGNVLRIAPISILTREDEEQRRLRESKELAGPLYVKTITLSYSKARDVKALLETKKSPRGEIVIDDRTNTLIISDVKDKLDLLEKLISVLDTPTPQVSIEARIVEATSNFIRNLGIQWGFNIIADPFYGNPTSLQFPNKVLVDGAMIPQGEVTKGLAGPLGGYAINLPAPAFSTALGFSLANVMDTFRLDIALSALETSGEGRIISCPKITTQNNMPAEIIQGRQIPVQTVANFTVTTRYVNAALELRATPQITAEGTIIMTIQINNDAADFANLVNGIPPIITQRASTTVMVADGGTTVIGGIYRTEDSITRERVPFLHSIPILGNLFRSFARTKQNRELLIFITPRIVK